ncbi:hypothetical protein GQ53DRAFT_819966 [Thozetella sp. PMI_491]|nr:hypothetical protein GQ53DRAFT_819966 [Thozetella sp. PMI_491]
MDPISAVGFAASIASLLQITYHVARTSYSCLSTIKNAQSTKKAYRNEVAAFIEVLLTLERAVEYPCNEGLVKARSDELGQLILQCSRDMESIQSELAKKSGPFGRLRFAIQEQQLKEHIQKLHRYRNILSDFVSSCILVTTTSMHSQLGVMATNQERARLLAIWATGQRASKPWPTAHPGTGTWFIMSAPYESWVAGDPDSRPVLWCYGPPGVGKSVIASVAVQDLKRMQNGGLTTFYVVHFFCDFSLRSRQTVQDILKAMLCQLVEQGDQELLGILREDLTSLEAGNSPMQLEAILKKACGTQKKVFFVLDAEDELEREVRIFVTKLLLGMEDSACRILITSRFPPEQSCAATSIPIEGNRDDMRAYVKERLAGSELLCGADTEGILSSLTEDLV